MKPSRRAVLSHTLSITALAGFTSTTAKAAPPDASGAGLRLVEVNVKDFGALGDGNTDDTAAIHAARDAVGVGGTIVIPPGTYLVSGLLANVADQTWELVSASSVIKMQAGAPSAMSVTANGVTIRGGAFDCSSGMFHDWSQHGLTLSAVDRLTIREVVIRDSPKHAVHGVDCNYVTITNCTFLNSWGAGVFIQNKLGSPSDIHDFLIADNLIDNSSSSSNVTEGIVVRGEDLTRTVSRARVHHNTVLLPSKEELVNGCISVTNGTDYVVSSNVLVGGFFGITCPDPRRATISNNVVRGFSSYGIEIPGNVFNTVVAGNSIDADGFHAGTGISVSWHTPVPVENLTISGNTIGGFPTGPSFGIAFGSRALLNRVAITGNTLTSAVGSGQFYGIYCNDSVTNLNIVGNVIDASSTAGSYGIAFLGAVAGVSITGNQLSNIAEAAVHLSGTGGPFDHVNFAGNQIRNCGAGLGGGGLTSATNLTSDSR